MTELGQILTSGDDAHPDLRVIGAADGNWVVEEADEFSSGPRVLADDEAAAYGVTDSPPEPDEQAGWNELAKQPHGARRRILHQRKPTPEELLASGEATPVSYLREDGTISTDPKGHGERHVWQQVTVTELPR